ncbi:MAG TPA: hypothetical protein VFV38_19105 [Ktedonobacteraceae bacterium]|nr:hypothetical protein [Ktedonobacteraceae bacterium]
MEVFGHGPERRSSLRATQALVTDEPGGADDLLNGGILLLDSLNFVLRGQHQCCFLLLPRVCGESIPNRVLASGLTTTI